MAEDLVEGWTEPIDATLLADGAAPTGTGKTLGLVLKDRDGSLVDTTGKVSWLVEASGTVRFTPVATDLKASGSPYTARWKVTLSGQDSFFPNKEPDTWTVRPQ